MNRVRFSRYDDVLTYIFRQLPIYQRQGPKALKYDLSNITSFMDSLGNPHKDFKSIHVAGTNGKGSTSHFIAAGLQANGMRTGLYTSPHYKDYRERIRIDGKWIATGFITEFFNKHIDVIDKLKPSYFELSVALAFTYFSEEKVDIAVVEVGLGGRLDSTNIIRPLLSVITNISWDHMQTLGNTLAEIAAEKAGIIKNQVPVVVGDYQEETYPVFEKIAAENQAPLFYTKDQVDDMQLESIKTAFSGPFTRINQGYAWSSLKILARFHPELKIDLERAAASFSNVTSLTGYLGRWQLLGSNPTVIADGAHNTGGWKTILAHLGSLDYGSLHLVLGFVHDKSYHEILSMLPKDAHYYYCEADIPRALPAEELGRQAASLGLKGITCSSVSSALDKAKQLANEEDLILVCGSIFVVGEIL